MCPLCITAAALVAAKAGGASGLTALVARTLHRKRAANRVAAETDPERRDGSTVAYPVHQKGAGQ